MTRESILETAGELVAIESAVDWVSALLEDAAAGALAPRHGPSTMTISIESSRQPFSVDRLIPLTRGAWSGAGEVVMEDVGGSGFDLRMVIGGGRPEATYRWRPRPSRLAARSVLPARFQLLAREVLVHYPVLWWASIKGRSPLHAVACTAGDAVVLLAGPGGVGKSTLLQRELADGGRATSDNLCAGDGRSVWGLVEPMRVIGHSGRHMTHGRVEVVLRGRVLHLVPDHVVVVRRGDGDAPLLRSCDFDTAVRSLVTGTYAAGELGRFWAFAATLAAGTGLGPDHPPIVDVARAFAQRLACYELILPRTPGARLSEILSRVEAIA